MDNFNGANGNANNIPNMQNNMNNGMQYGDMNDNYNGMQYGNVNGMNGGMYNGGNGYRQNRPPVKRTSSGIVILIIVLFMVISGVAFVGTIVAGYIAATTEKEKITSSEFMDECSDKALEIQDVTSSKLETGVTKVYEASKTGGTYKVEFYEFDTVQNAQTFFEKMKTFMEREKGNNGITTSVNMKNFGHYSVKANGKYMYVAYVDNTVLYADGKSSDETEVKDLIDEIDY